MISIIIPGYNCEKTISRTLESLLAQSFKDFEIIFVDDGSIDSSTEIVQAFCDKHSFRYKCLRQDNCGPGSARNIGILNSSGEYIAFFDSDDYIPENCLESLVALMISSQSDLCVGDYYKIKDNNGLTTAIRNNYYGTFCSEETLVRFLKNEAYISLWNSLFKKSIIVENNIKFKDECFNGEDVLFILEYLTHSYTISFSDSFVYCFYYDSSRAMLRSLKDSVKKESDFLYWPLVKLFDDYGMGKAKMALLFGKFPLISMHEIIKEAYSSNSYRLFKNKLHHDDKELVRIVKNADSKYIKRSLFKKMKFFIFALRFFPILVYFYAKKKMSSYYQ